MDFCPVLHKSGCFWSRIDGSLLCILTCQTNWILVCGSCTIWARFLHLLHCERLSLLKDWLVLTLWSWNLTCLRWGLLWSYLTLNHRKMKLAWILRFLDRVNLLELEDSWVKVIDHLHLLLSVFEVINHLLRILLYPKSTLPVHMLTSAYDAWSTLDLQICHWLYLPSNNICKSCVRLKRWPLLQAYFLIIFT